VGSKGDRGPRGRGRSWERARPARPAAKPRGPARTPPPPDPPDPQLKRAREQVDQGKSVLLVKSSVDGRYSASEVVTHTGDRQACVVVETLGQLVGDPRLEAADVVAIDEAQFFGDLAEFVVHAADVRRKLVLVAGLSGDFRRRPFGQMGELVSLADSLDTLAAECAMCGGPARFTVRLTGGSDVTEVGGAERYQPVCRGHYREFAARHVDSVAAGLRAPGRGGGGGGGRAGRGPGGGGPGGRGGGGGGGGGRAGQAPVDEDPWGRG